jgi:alpha-mannosidase
VSLYPGVRRVEFRSEVDNRARDHRLRALFPTGVQARLAAAEQHFGAIARPLALPEADDTWMEQPVGTFPQKSFVDVSDGQRGVTLANRGLPEYEVLPGPNGATIALTLLRCIGWLCRADMTTRRGPAGPPFLQVPDAQCPGRHTFEYALIPHEGDWRKAFAQAHRFRLPMQARAATGEGSLPPRGSLLEVSPQSVRLSGLKFAEGGSGVIVRLYNIDDRPVRARVRLNEPHEGVKLVTLDERPIRQAPVRNGRVDLRLKRNEIVSLLFRTKLWRRARKASPSGSES